jgi:hypothetical protein
MDQQSLTLYPLECEVSLIPASSPTSLEVLLPASTTMQLTKMFRDPYVLEKEERVALIEQLREAVALEPSVPELRVVFGMALCVNFEAQKGLEELRTAAQMAPDNFLARLKFGEILMRLRVCKHAALETHAAAKLACNPIQSELARKQAAAIRTMLREGIEHGGQGKIVSMFDWIFGLFTRTEESRTSTALNTR